CRSGRRHLGFAPGTWHLGPPPGPRDPGSDRRGPREHREPSPAGRGLSRRRVYWRAPVFAVRHPSRSQRLCPRWSRPNTNGNLIRVLPHRDPLVFPAVRRARVPRCADAVPGAEATRFITGRWPARSLIGIFETTPAIRKIPCGSPNVTAVLVRV